MPHALTNYNGVQIVMPEGDLSADRQALNANFKNFTMRKSEACYSVL